MDIVEQLREYGDYPEDVSDGEWAEYSHKAANEIERLRNKVRWLEMCENTVVKQNVEIERLRELLQQWLGNCFVDTYGQGVTFGMGVKKVWAETRAALKEGE